MNLKNILTTVIIAVSGLVNAQQISKESFEKSVDFINCKSVELSLKGKTEILIRFQQSCPCKNGIGASETNEFLTSVGGYDATISLSNEIELLKRGFNKNWKTEDAAKFLTETIFSDKNKYQKLYSFADKRIKENKASFETFKLDLKENLVPILESSAELSSSNDAPTEITSQVELSSLDQRLTLLEQKTEPNAVEKSWFDGITFQFDVFAILISIITILIILKIFYINSDSGSVVSENIKTYVKSKISDASNNNGGSNSSVNSYELKNLKDEIEKLKIEIKKLNASIENTKIPLEIVQTKQESSYQTTKESEIKTETFFLSSPNSEGSFNESSASNNYKEGASIYKFTKMGNGRARFQIDERETSIKLAIQYPDRSIIPVCDSINEFEPKYTRLSTLNQGEVELTNGKWKVTSKAKIKYES